MRYKRSALKEQILRGLDDKLIERAQSISAVTDNFEEKLSEGEITFKVDKYEVKVSAQGERDNLDLHLTCSCDYWVYQGPEFHAKNEDYLLGSPRGSAERPEKRDPNGSHKVCKHVYSVLRDYF